MKTLAIFYPGCNEFEILLACEILNSKFPVVVTTPNGCDHHGSNGMTIKSDLSFDEVDPKKFKVVLIPGGDPGILIGNKTLNMLIQELELNRSIFGAICAGPIVLEQAGLLKGQKIAHGYKGAQLRFLKEKGFFKETILTEEPIIVSERVVTARSDSFIDFAIEVSSLAGVIPSSEIDFYKKHYRGTS